jgi:prepilin-type N-terminal cleavage/methylation domain-containing protein
MVNRIAIKKGFTLLELTVVLVIVGVILVTIIGNCTNYMNRAKFQSTVREMNSLAQAAIDNYNSSNNPNDTINPQPLVWPGSTALLSNNANANNNNMPQGFNSNPTNPFGNGYQISYGNNMVTVTTVIPIGVPIDPTEGSFLHTVAVAGGNQISTTLSISNEFTGRLTYDIKYPH